jgi:hypothetical protein
MFYFTGTDWDEFGRLLMAVGLLAMVAYLAPGMMSLRPAWARRLQLAGLVLVLIALALAATAAVVWFLG